MNKKVRVKMRCSGKLLVDGLHQGGQLPLLLHIFVPQFLYFCGYGADPALVDNFVLADCPPQNSYFLLQLFKFALGLVPLFLF